MAQPQDEGACLPKQATPRVPGDAPHHPEVSGVRSDAERLFCDETQALQDGASFVSAVSARESLVKVAVNLLRSEDERIKQRTWERLVNLGPGRGSAAEEQQVIWDMPRPIRE